MFTNDMRIRRNHVPLRLPGFLLSSCKQSSNYFDCKVIYFNPRLTDPCHENIYPLSLATVLNYLQRANIKFIFLLLSSCAIQY